MHSSSAKLKSAAARAIAVNGMGGIESQKIFIYQAMMAFFILVLLTLLPSAAYAGTDPLTQTICTVVKWFSGSMGRSIATLGVLVLAIGALMGKVSWGMCLTVCVGISIMLSGGEMVTLLTQKNNVCAGVTGPNPGAMAEVLCRLAELASKPTGKAFGTLAVVFLGIAALFAKISYPQALIVGAGIGAFFNAPELVGLLYGGSTGALQCSPTGTP